MNADDQSVHKLFDLDPNKRIYHSVKYKESISNFLSPLLRTIQTPVTIAVVFSTGAGDLPPNHTSFNSSTAKNGAIFDLSRNASGGLSDVTGGDGRHTNNNHI